VVVCGLGNVGFRTVENLVFHGIRVATVEAGSEADGMRLDELEKGGHIHLIAVRADEEASWTPERDRQVAAGHEILVAAHRDGLQRLRSIARKGG
jgi:Trk K+ transport system NAD-binding subunit